VQRHDGLRETGAERIIDLAAVPGWTSLWTPDEPWGGACAVAGMARGAPRERHQGPWIPLIREPGALRKSWWRVSSGPMAFRVCTHSRSSRAASDGRGRPDE
jgi:hypothetical protein